MFESITGNFDIQKTHINNKGEYVVTAGENNFGILGKTDIKARVIKKHTITIDMFGYSFYRSHNYKLVTHARVFALNSKFEISEKQMIFIKNSLNYLTTKFGYNHMCTWSKVKDLKIKLPTKDHKIDFDFMESFVAELEAQRIAELEAYLKVTGLNNYIKTKEEEKAIADFKSGKVEVKEYRIEELFEINSSKKRFDANKIVLTEFGNPYVVRMSGNNGIKGYLEEEEKYLNEENTISFGQDTATMFYQKKPYFTGDKIKILKLKKDKLTTKKAMFLISTMKKSFSIFSWGSNSFSVNSIKKEKIKLPIKNNEIDYKYMEIFVSAIQKEVIENVVKYLDLKIETTKKVVFDD